MRHMLAGHQKFVGEGCDWCWPGTRLVLAGDATGVGKLSDKYMVGVRKLLTGDAIKVGNQLCKNQFDWLMRICADQ